MSERLENAGTLAFLGFILLTPSLGGTLNLPLLILLLATEVSGTYGRFNLSNMLCSSFNMSTSFSCPLRSCTFPECLTATLLMLIVPRMVFITTFHRNDVC